MGQLEQHPLAVDAVAQVGQRPERAQVGEGGGLERRRAELPLADPVRLDLERPVAGCPLGGVGAAHEGVRPSAAVAVEIQGQHAAHDHRGPCANRGEGGRLTLGPRALGAQVDDALARDDAFEHEVAEVGTALERLTQRLVEGKVGQRRVEGVEGLHRAAARGVGVQHERHHLAFHPRCSATIPPAWFCHSTSVQPTSAITSASSGWLGHAAIDSAR